ncbi:hypothetical protein DKX38_022311 [Salix brachista]|uniref:Response regulatory domain-containing protein n=1 Tax=Salix brachista TaxID=2182728 RepID=A0A5N5JZV8_9ROSI|nr:hypothetical protein DKX38_022311 [Salix brachista]
MVEGAYATALKGGDLATSHVEQATLLMIAGVVTPTGKRTASALPTVALVLEENCKPFIPTSMADQDQSNNFSVLIVDDDRIVRETNRRFTALAGTQKQLRMEFQEAKNGKEAVYLHLAGASFDLILMDFQMPIMNGIQLLRQMGVKSRIVGVTSESDQQAFFDVGLNNCIQKPLNPAKIAEFLIVSKKRKRIGTSQA